MVMKKSIVFVALAAIFCLSCKKTDDRFDPAPRQVLVSDVLSVSLSDSSVVIPQGACLSAWKLKDTLGYYYTSIETGNKVNFELDPNQDAPTQIAYAVYPDVKVDSLRVGVFYLNFPARQELGNNASDGCVYAGFVENNNVILQNASGILTFTLNQDEVGKCVFKCNQGQAIAGYAKLAMTKEISVTKVPGRGIDRIELEGEEVQFQKGSTHSIAVLPGTYDLSYNLISSEGVILVDKTVSDKVTVASGQKVDIGNIGTGKPVVHASGISLDKTLIDTLEVESTTTLTATVIPEEAVDHRVKWSAFPEGIVAIVGDGSTIILEGLSAGKATVKATTVDGGKTATCEVNVIMPLYRYVNASQEDFESLETKWPQGSAISVFKSFENKKFVLKPGEAGKSNAVFRGDCFEGGALTGISPYDDTATYDGNTFTTTFGAEQKVLADTPCALSVADINDGDFTFKNVSGLLKFEIKGDNVGEVVITGNNGENLAGKVNVSFVNGEPEYSVVEGAKSVSLKMADNTPFAKGSYYAAVLPQTFANGFKITLKPYAFKLDDVVIRSNKPENLEINFQDPITIERSKVKNVGTVDSGRVWNYSTMFTLGALRGSHKAAGCYMDLSTGRNFSPIGSYAYCDNAEFGLITNLSNGVAPTSVYAAGGYTNATNLSKFGDGYSYLDEINNADTGWKTKLQPMFCYVSSNELSDAAYNAITTVAQIKEIYDAHDDSAVNSYYVTTAHPVADCITNANRTTSHKFLVVKTYSLSEGTGYAIVKFGPVGGATWYINMNYKFGLE